MTERTTFYHTWGANLFYYFVIWWVLTPYYTIFFNPRVLGRKNIPKDRSVILASTHSSYHDPTILTFATKRNVAFMAKKELFEIPGLSTLITWLGAFSVNRRKLELSTIKTAKYILGNTKWCLGIFPQGTRIKDHAAAEIKPGFSYLAKAAKSPVLPVYIDLKKGKLPFYGNLTVKIGKPLPASNNPDEISENWKRAVLELAGL